MSEIKVNKISPKQTCTTVTLGDSGDDFVVATGANLKTAAVKDTAGNVIISRCGSNITIGSSGAAIALACGATQTGFGRTGTVDWDTTAKTASFTAVSGNGYFVNTTSGAITVTLPASPSANDIVAVSDYNGTAGTNAITVGRNSSNINGAANDYLITKANSAVTFIYVDATSGWTSVQTSNISDNQNPFIVATGGTETFCGDYKIHTFTGPGTFTVTSTGPLGTTVDYLVVAGGGSGGGRYGGGGGGGGYRESSGSASGGYTRSPLGACVAALPVSITAYPITVGGGGTGVPATPGSDDGNRGSNSVFSTITSTGGGAGSGQAAFSPLSPGGSGGGGSYGCAPAVAAGGTGNTPPVSPSQGFPGGNGYVPNSPYSTGGGGGATEAGVNATGSPSAAGRGGAGATSSIAGSPVGRSGGGGGSGEGSHGVTFGAGSPCGSGTAGGASATDADSGAANRGGGGGGAYYPSTNLSGNGGSGVVIIRYKYQ